VTIPTASFIPGTPQAMRLYQGDDKRYPFRVRYRNTDGTLGAAIDLTGCTAAAQLRADYETTETLATFLATVAPDQAGASRGIVTLSLTGAQTAAIQPLPGTRPDAQGFYPCGVWDVQITYPDGRVQTYLAADAVIRKQVTR
jgi:hypothetical protein